jgi:hypothetical protein
MRRQAVAAIVCLNVVSQPDGHGRGRRRLALRLELPPKTRERDATETIDAIARNCGFQAHASQHQIAARMSEIEVHTDHGCCDVGHEQVSGFVSVSPPLLLPRRRVALQGRLLVKPRA